MKTQPIWVGLITLITSSTKAGARQYQSGSGPPRWPPSSLSASDTGGSNQFKDSDIKVAEAGQAP